MKLYHKPILINLLLMQEMLLKMLFLLKRLHLL